MSLKPDNSKDLSAGYEPVKQVDIWLYLSAGILVTAFLFVFISYSIFLFNNADSVVIGSVTFVY